MLYIDSPRSAGASPDVLDLQAQGPEKVFELIYSRARDGSFIAVGSRRPGKNNPEPFPHYLTILPVKKHQRFLPGILSCRPDETKCVFLSKVITDSETI